MQELQEAVEALTKENLRYVREEAAKAATNQSATTRQTEGRPREKNLLLAALLAAPPGPLSLSALLVAVKEVEAGGPDDSSLTRPVRSPTGPGAAQGVRPPAPHAVPPLAPPQSIRRWFLWRLGSDFFFF